MYQRSTERNSSYLGRSWIRLGISINQEVSRGHSTYGNEPLKEEKKKVEDSQIKEGLNVNLLEMKLGAMIC